MADEPQQQRPTDEMWKKMQNDKEKKEKTNTSSSSGSRNWLVKFAKDVAYISFFPYLWLKELWNWIFNNRSKKGKLNQSVNIIKNKDNVKQQNNATTNSNGQVSFKEVDALDPETESLAQALNLNANTNNPFQNVAHSCNHEEVPPITTKNAGKKLTD